MAARTSAGTGVIVSLVVFIIISVALLVLTIVFYGGRTDAIAAQSQAEQTLSQYVRATDRASDRFQRFEGNAKKAKLAVAPYLAKQFEELMGVAHGSRSTSLEELRAATETYGVNEQTSMLAALQDSSRDLRNRDNENDSLKRQLGDISAEKDEAVARIQSLNQQHQQELDAVEGQIQGYRDSAERYADEVTTAKNEMQQRVERLINQHDGEVRELENEIDTLGQQNVVLKGRINEFERAFQVLRARRMNPALMVDGHVIDSPDSNDRVFIDRGRQQRIVLGMTFEVYGDESMIRVDERTGALPRGKASLQVIKVGQTTSTCKITRQVPGRPVVRDDVIANAVYDPDYQFKFLVHGKFDFDGDNKPTEGEADFIRSLVIEAWGGTVVTGNDLPGDLDFLVLGVQPPRPTPLGPGASDFELQDFIHRNRAFGQYENLKKQASEAQIPILNANRFFILIGYTER